MTAIAAQIPAGPEDPVEGLFHPEPTPIPLGTMMPFVLAFGAAAWCCIGWVGYLVARAVGIA
jgi:hypothetical protein